MLVDHPGRTSRNCSRSHGGGLWAGAHASRMKCGSERQLQSQPAARTQPINNNSRPTLTRPPRRSCDGLGQCSSQVRSGTEPAFPSDWVRSLCPRVKLPFEHASRQTTSHDLVQLRTRAVRRRRASTAQRASRKCAVFLTPDAKSSAAVITITASSRRSLGWSRWDDPATRDPSWQPAAG